MSRTQNDTEIGLVGRSLEWSHLSSMLSSTVESGGALLLTGDPGSGKSALLDATARAARRQGIEVVRCVGTEFEAAIGFAALHQLLHRFVDRLDDIPAPFSTALSVALGLADAPPANRLVLSSAALALLRVSAHGPALVIVDDVHWVDAPTAEVLAMMTRRVDGTRIGILVARRTATADMFEQEQLPELHIGALDAAASAELLAREYPSLDRGLVRRVIDASDGNPLALLELPKVIAPEQSSDRAEALPLTDRLKRAFSVQIADLPSETRRLLLLAVLDGSGDPALLQRATVGESWLKRLEPAQRRGLVTMGAKREPLRLRHPLIGAAVVTVASDEERRDAHRTIAELSDDTDRRAWHAGAATDGPDDDVAAAIESAGQRRLRRGDAAGAIRSWVRAGRLSTHPRDRARRLAMAASHAAVRGTHFREPKDLLAEALAADPSLRGSLNDATAAAILLVNTDGNVDAAYELLAAAIPDVAAQLPPLEHLQNYLAALGFVSWHGERAPWWERFHELVSRLDPAPGSWLRGIDGLSADPAHRGCAVIDELDVNLARIGIGSSPDDILSSARCSYWVDRLRVCHSALLSVWDSKNGDRTSLSALMYACVAEQQMGDWSGAVRHAAAGLQRCAGSSVVIHTCEFQLVEGLIAAGRGDVDRAVVLANEIERWARPRGIGFGVSGAHHIRMLIAWAQGEPEDVYRHATAISPAGVLRSHAPRALLVALDDVEAAERTGRHEEAVAHVEALRSAQVARLSPRLALISMACEAMISEGDEMLERFESALAIAEADRSPFDFARVHLALGGALRRQRAETTRARAHLKQAATIFRALGAVPWADRADAEIRATGQRRADSGRSRSTLTAQELQIAQLAATGMRNKEIGAELYLSPRTVSAHLYRIFPKLGITSRAALRDALSSLDD